MIFGWVQGLVSWDSRGVIRVSGLSCLGVLGVRVYGFEVSRGARRGFRVQRCKKLDAAGVAWV